MYDSTVCRFMLCQFKTLDSLQMLQCTFFYRIRDIPRCQTHQVLQKLLWTLFYSYCSVLHTTLKCKISTAIVKALNTIMQIECIKNGNSHSNAAAAGCCISFWKSTANIIPLLNAIIPLWNQGSSKIYLPLFKDIILMSFPDSVP